MVSAITDHSFSEDNRRLSLLGFDVETVLTVSQIIDGDALNIDEVAEQRRAVAQHLVCHSALGRGSKRNENAAILPERDMLYILRDQNHVLRNNGTSEARLNTPP